MKMRKLWFAGFPRWSWRDEPQGLIVGQVDLQETEKRYTVPKDARKDGVISEIYGWMSFFDKDHPPKGSCCETKEQALQEIRTMLSGDIDKLDAELSQLYSRLSQVDAAIKSLE